MTKPLVTLFAPGPFGGAERVILTSVAKLKDMQLWLIKETRNPNPCLEFEKLCHANKISFKTLECNSQFDTHLLKKLKEYINLYQIELIHSHGMKANFYNALLPVKKVATQHGKTSHDFKVKILEKIEHLALKKMDAVICVSESMYNDENYKNKFFIPNFLSLNFVKTSYKNNGIVKLLFIGRLSPEKGLDILIPALEKIQNIELIVVGTGSKLESYKKMSFSFPIHFMGFQTNITPFIEEADALVMPSIREGLPMTLIEATASGLPIIASNVGGIPLLVYENGLLFNVQDKNDIIKKIELFIKNRFLYNQKAQEFKNVVKEKYSLNKWLTKTQEIYGKLR